MSLHRKGAFDADFDDWDEENQSDESSRSNHESHATYLTKPKNARPQPTVTPLYQAVIDYRQRGWMPIDLPAGTKRITHPGWEELRYTQDQLRQRFNNGPKNVGILLGKPSNNLIDIDLDCPQARILAPTFLPSTDAIFGRLGNPSSHWLYMPDAALTTTKYLDPDSPADEAMLVEIRSTGAQTIFPPSIHPSGETIHWTIDGDPSLIDSKLIRNCVDRLAAATLLARRWVSGQRHELAGALAGSLLRSNWPEENVAAFINAVARAAGDDETDDREGFIATTVERLQHDEAATGWPRLAELLGERVIKKLRLWLHIRQGPAEGADATRHTDVGNARRLVHVHGQDLRYVHRWNKWLCYEDGAWSLDETGEIMRRAKTIPPMILDEGLQAADPATRRELVKFALRSEYHQRLMAMIELAKSEPGIPIRHEQLDADPWLLTVENGTLNLRTGELREHRREDLITKTLDVAYDPAAECPHWMQFLQTIFLGREDLIEFVRRAVGYSLTGLTSERALFIMYGGGANGKTVFLRTIAQILSSYAVRTPIETLLVKHRQGVPNDVAALNGARFVYTAEANDGAHLNEALIKDLTGGDRISARFMRGEFFEFLPSFKIWLASNYKPVIKGSDDAIWGRLKLIPFEYTFSDEEKRANPQHKVLERFWDERSGILRWALLGCQAWVEHGLETPQVVDAATQSYRDEMDILKRIAPEIFHRKGGSKVGATALYQHFVEAMKSAGEKAIWSQRRFGIEFAKTFPDIAATKKNDGHGMVYYGIALNFNVEL